MGEKKIVHGKKNVSNMSGSDDFLHLSCERFLYIHMSEHIQEDVIVKHLACVVYS